MTSVNSEGESWCEQFANAAAGPAQPPPPTAIVLVPHNPLPGMVDMNVLCFQRDLVKNAIKLVLYEITKVTLEPDGSLKLREYDRINSLLRHFGVLNARIDWNPQTRTIGIS